MEKHLIKKEIGRGVLHYTIRRCSREFGNDNIKIVELSNIAIELMPTTIDRVIGKQMCFDDSKPLAFIVDSYDKADNCQKMWLDNLIKSAEDTDTIFYIITENGNEDGVPVTEQLLILNNVVDYIKGKYTNEQVAEGINEIGRSEMIERIEYLHNIVTSMG